jgi:hypothetical protein
VDTLFKITACLGIKIQSSAGEALVYGIGVQAYKQGA